MPRISVVIAISFLAVAVSHLADGAPGEWKLLKSTNFTDNGISTQKEAVYLSLTGEKAVQYNREEHLLNVYAFPEGKSTQYKMPDNFKGRPTYLSWSPSGRYIAFCEDFIKLDFEPDIWVFDTAAGTFGDLTDDSITGPYFPFKKGMSFDYLPFWDTVAERIYYFHSNLGSGDSLRTFELFRVVPGGKPERVADLSATLPGFSLTSLPAVSPDGTKVLLASFSPEKNAATNGFWVYDLAENKLARLVSMDNFFAAFPFRFDGNLRRFEKPGECAWVSGGDGIVVSFENGYYEGPPIFFGYYGMKSRKLSILCDFTGIKSFTDILKLDAEGYTRFQRFPRLCVVMPDVDSLVYFAGRNQEDFSLMRMRLPPDKSRPVLIGRCPFFMSGMFEETRLVRAAKNGAAVTNWPPRLFEFEQ
jgi:hypothetical protein